MGDQGKELEKTSRANYAITRYTAERVKALFEANFAGAQLTFLDLTRARVPGGGGTDWQIVSGDDVRGQKELKGVVLHQRDVRAFWRGSVLGKGPTGSPPDCTSTDARTGRGLRWEGDQEGEHDCATCRWAAWGSQVRPDGTQGAGQACKSGKLVFLLEEDRLLPTVVTVPPGSLKSMRAYLVNELAGAGHMPWEVETVLALARARSRDGIDYARVAPRVGREFSPEEALEIAERVRAIAPYLSATRPAYEDFVAGTDSE